ncbi:hypothetical protein EW146_g2084 [Bondarzewia mesenterica]|uniref:Transcription termination and cleavage factor C-terminal domain-containing protein n=1 Tax=Bondarzewia mesenterica TaxID=1095465 RepID=A0A4S4M279_9AGAM|nr:hypothetical protein EW146_g2084 [Bondarzewia mesenterica]
MTKMNAINVDVTQKTLATFGSQQNGVAATQPPPAVQPVPALPLHMAPQPSRGGTPQYATPPPPSYPLAHPSKYHPYTNGAVMPPQQTSQYSAQPPQAYAATQSAASVIPDALAAMPEEQRAMIMRFISMTPDQINQLPPAERASIMQLISIRAVNWPRGVADAMPPRPLQNLSSARAYPSDTQGLTPRTPHSRAGRAEEAFTEVELEQFGDDEYRTYSYAHQQSEPLLASSASTSFPPSGIRARGDEGQVKAGKAGPAERMVRWSIKNAWLWLGSLMAVVLFIMVVLSWKRPEALLRAIGEKNATVLGEGDPAPSIPSQEPPLNEEDLISYANYTQFPLRPVEYRAECDKLMGGFMPPHPYWWGTKDVLHHKNTDPGKYHLPEGERTETCSSTITYMLDGHVGLLADLALMAQAAALAREDVRARQPGPEPGCRAPPPEDLVACPRTARHWVINSRTALYHFGHGFFESFEDPYARQLNRLKPIYQQARQSLRQTIRPNAATAALIRSVRTELASLLPEPFQPALASSNDARPSTDPGRYVAVHIRRGDRFGLSWKYHGKHIPTEDYAQAASDTWSRLFLNSSAPTSKLPAPIVYLAFDDPSAQENFRAQLSVDTTFFSLAESKDGDLRALASPNAYVQKEFNALWEEERIKRTKGMIVDFAMVSGLWGWEDDVVPGAVVCGMASSVCRLSAVGYGWDRAFGHGFVDHVEGDIDEEHNRWVEIDEKGVVEPVWQPFEVFN